MTPHSFVVSSAPPEDKLYLSSNRRLAYRIFGTPQGRPLYFFHGFPGCSLQAGLVHAQAARAGVALVAFDRPGFGGSDFIALHDVTDLMDDVQALADHLGHARFATLGISCGGPYALAAARHLPDRVQAVGLLGAIGPMDRHALRQGQMPMLRLLFTLARWHPGLIAPLLALDRFMFRRDATQALAALSRMLTPPDRQLLDSDSTLRARFAASLADAYRTGIRGAMYEAHRIARYDTRALENIRLPVHIYEAGHDTHVPVAMSRYMAIALPRAVLHVCDDEGHLSVFVREFSDCVRHVLRASDEIAAANTKARASWWAR